MKRHIYIIILLLFAGFIVAAPPKKTSGTTKKKRVIERLDKGSFFQIAAGGGVSSLQYNLAGGEVHPYPSLNLHFGYTYYFNKYVGINTGLQYTTYTSRAVMKEPLQWNNLTDYTGDSYIHYTRFNNWQERQAIHSLEIPLAFTFKYKPQKAGLYATLGAKAGIAVDQHYINTRGTVSHSAYYPFWNVTMQELPDRYETEDYTGLNRQLPTHRINAIGYTEIGTLIELNPHTDLTIGAYADIYLNNAARFDSQQMPDLGFATRLNNYGTFMNPYNGLIGTTQASSTFRPWAAGLKIGISITPQRTDKEKERKAKKLYRQYKKYMPQCENDTVFVLADPSMLCDSCLRARFATHDTIFIHDTVIISQPKETETVSQLTLQQSEKLDSMLQGAIIWFHFDEYIPILQPEYILDSVAGMLLANQELRVHINGHACSIGSDSYNQRLALQRANAVADLLVAKGVNKEQLIVASFGATEPFRYNGRHQLATDRRVEIIPAIFDERIRIANPKTDGRTELYTRFIGEEKSKQGTTLADLAHKWYGQRVYWVYIYEANADFIDNPNRLVPDMTIMIPDLNASLADQTEEQRLHHARQLEAAYKK